MTFIPEKLGIKSSNQDNFLKYFESPISNHGIRAVSPANAILAAIKIL
jgi:hypothetical protein